VSKFTDSNGNEWTLRLKLGHRKPLAELGVGFNGANFGETIGAFMAATADPDVLAKVVHAITVSPPSTVAELADSFDGKTFAAASLALSDEVIDFFHHGRPATTEAARAAVTTLVSEQDRQTATALTRFVSGGNSPESPESIPPT
jgi:hypothetical protein